jgi:hypothetical protein
MTEPTLRNLPAPTKHAAEIARVTTSVALAVAGIWFPPAAIAAAAMPFVIDRYVNRPRDLLIEALERGEIRDLSAERLEPFVPMAYKFMEAAKEGEYLHNLEILAAFLTGEMRQEIPDAASFSRMARRIEGRSIVDLKVMALIDDLFSQGKAPTLDFGVLGKRQYAATSSLFTAGKDRFGLSAKEIGESLTDLASRGLLLADGATRTSKHEEYYFTTSSFDQLMERARAQIKTVG